MNKTKINNFLESVGLEKILQISRPKEYKFLVLPFIFGIFFVTEPHLFLANLQKNWFILLLIGFYFSLPANLLLHGLQNTKLYKNLNFSDSQEADLTSEENNLWLLIAVLNIPMLLIAVFLHLSAFIAFFGFIFFAIFYSLEPIRAKEKPLLEPLFFSLYTFPFLISHAILNNQIVNKNFIFLLLANIFGTYASRVFFLLIRKQNTSVEKEILLTFETKKSLFLCLILYFLAAFSLFPFIAFFSLIPFFITTFPILQIFHRQKYFTKDIYQNFINSHIILAITLPLILLILNL